MWIVLIVIVVVVVLVRGVDVDAVISPAIGSSPESTTTTTTTSKSTAISNIKRVASQPNSDASSRSHPSPPTNPSTATNQNLDRQAHPAVIPLPGVVTPQTHSKNTIQHHNTVNHNNHDHNNINTVDPLFVQKTLAPHSSVSLQEDHPVVSSGTAPFQLPSQFRTHAIPLDTNRGFDPNFLLYHHTRYVKGCFTNMKADYPYFRVVPFVFNFDILITTCSIDWNNLGEITPSPCVYVTNRREQNISKHLSHLQIHPDITYVHVRSWGPSLEYFRHNVLPKFEQEGKVLILHTGSEDHSVYYAAQGKRFLDSPSIIRWVTEQNRDPLITAHPKVLQYPVGFCAREIINEAALELNEAMQKTGPALTLASLENNKKSLRRSLVTKSTKSERDKDADSLASVHYTDHWDTLRRLSEQALPLEKRLNRVFFCFHTSYPNRERLMNYAKHNCTICDVCEKGWLDHLDLWMTYAKYKFVVAPHGNGADCSRNFEIILLGSIPVMEYFEGTNGYLAAGIKLIPFQSEWEIHERNLTTWSKQFTTPTDRKLVTRQYWNQQAFEWKGPVPVMVRPTIRPVTRPATMPTINLKPGPTPLPTLPLTEPKDTKNSASDLSHAKKKAKADEASGRSITSMLIVLVLLGIIIYLVKKYEEGWRLQIVRDPSHSTPSSTSD